MRILLATYWQLPFVGGVSSYMELLKQRLEAMGHEVDILGNGIDRYHILHNYRSIDKEKIMPLLYAKLHPQLAPLLHQHVNVLHAEFDRYCLELSAAYLGLHKYDLIHTQDILSTRAFNRIKPKTTPLVATIHGCAAREVLIEQSTYMPEETIKHSIVWKYYSSLERCGVSSSDVAITPSHWLKNMLVNEFGVPLEQFTVIPHGLDIPAFLQNMAHGQLVENPMGKKVIICTCRLDHIKGVHILLQALSKVKAIRNDWVCWIAGDGQQNWKLQQLASELGIQEDVRFLGRRDDVPYLLGHSDMLVMSSLQENQPFSVMEAQIAGLPVIVSDVGGLPEMVDHGVNGLTFPSGNNDVLAGHIVTLLENDLYRNTMGAKAREWGMKMWSLDTLMERLLQIYDLAKSRSSRMEPVPLHWNLSMKGLVGMEVTGDDYNRLFAELVSTPDISVDYSTWNKLFNSLPRDYLLPDQAFLALLRD
jgi:glycosyltransferase involved in cell wall biosynthesis